MDNNTRNEDQRTVSDQARKVSFSEKFGYGLGDLAINFTWASMGMFIVYFYTDVIGIAASIVGTIIFFSRFLDGISDVVMGAIVDRTNSKHGKGRPWILWLALPFAVFTILLFTVPDIGTTGQILYIIISYNVLVLFFTALTIPYGTLNAMITKDKHQREQLNIFRMFLANIGVIIVSNFTIPFVNLFGGGQSGWVIVFTIFSAIAVVLFFITFRTTKERVVSEKKTKYNLPVTRSLKVLLKNKYWVIVFFYFIVYSVGFAINQGSTVYYAEYILGDPALVGVLTLAYLIPLIIGFLFVAPIYKRYGKRNSIIVGSLIFIGGSLIILIEPTSLVLVIIGQIIKGAGTASITGSLWALLPDTMEYGEWKSGVRNEGMTYSGGSMGNKLGVGIGTGSVGWILAIGNYDGGLDVQPDTAITAIFTIFIYIPIIVYILQIVLMYFYKLDKIYPKVVADLAEREEKRKSE